MRFLIDRCAGRQLANWLRVQGYDVMEASGEGPDPGDAALLERARADDRIVVTIDTDFGQLVYREGRPHAGLIRLPDVRSEERIALMRVLIEEHSEAMESGSVITIKGDRIRISKSVS